METCLEIPEEFKEKLKNEHLESLIDNISIYSLTNKYHYDDLEKLDEGDHEIVRDIAQNIVNRIPSIGGYEVCIVWSHNPAQIMFTKDDKYLDFNDMDSYSKAYIMQLFDPVIEEEKKTIKIKILKS